MEIQYLIKVLSQSIKRVEWFLSNILSPNKFQVSVVRTILPEKNINVPCVLDFWVFNTKLIKPCFAPSVDC